MLSTNPLTVFVRPPDGTFQVEVTFFLEPILTEVKGEAKFVAKCNLHFSVSGKEHDRLWEITTDADDLTEEAIRDMYAKSLAGINDVKDFQLMEHYHAKYRTSLVDMKLERAFGEALTAIAAKVEGLLSGKTEEKKIEPFADVSFEGPNVPLA